MVSKRLSREAGHRRKFLAVVDETPECERAVAYASKRAKSTGGVLVLLYVIEPGDFQHWLGVEKIMREEAMQAGGMAAKDARTAAEARIQQAGAAILARARSRRARSMLEPLIRASASTQREAIGRHATNETAAALDAQFVSRRDMYVRRALESWDRPQEAEAALTTAQGEVATRGGWRRDRRCRRAAWNAGRSARRRGRCARMRS